MTLSIIILTKNEEGNILDCIESASFADEIIVIDDNSEDRTLEVIKSLKSDKIRVYKNKLGDNFSLQRNFGLSKATCDWIMFLDADERISASLKNEIILAISTNNQDAYRIKRLDVMWGQELSHGEAGSVKLVRLARRNSGKWKGRVHEVWDTTGNVSELKHPLMHFPHPTVAEFLREISVYSTLRAQDLNQQGVKTTVWQIIFYPKAKFIVNYLLKMGFLDGIPGFVFAVMMSLHSFLTRVKLWLLQRE